jgi:electron transfer flavoprotein alpha/beta subunit
VSVAVWLGSAPPIRSIRWLDGTLAAAAKFGPATAVAAGDPTWLDLAADRANRLGLASAGVPTDLALDYLGWAQVMAAVARQLGVKTILVDEASRPERLPEVAAIAELLDAAQLTHVVAIAPDGGVIHASRVAGTELQTCRVRGTAVLGLRIAGPAIEEYPTPMPSATMKRLELAALGLDPVVLGHRALPPRSGQTPRRTVERVAEHLAVHLRPRRRPATEPPVRTTPPAGTRIPTEPPSRATPPTGTRRAPTDPPTRKGR